MRNYIKCFSYVAEKKRNSVSKRNIFNVVYGLYIVLLYLYISFSIG